MMMAAVLIFTPFISLLSFAQEEGVKTFIDQVARKLIDTMKDSSSSTKTKRDKVKEILENNFDVEWMGRSAMGVNYRKLTSEQKEQYAPLYLNYLLNNYFPILMKYDNDDSYEILKIQQIDQKDYYVNLKLTTKKSENPIVIKYRVRYIKSGYKCLDMVVEGISTLTSQRAEFSSAIHQSGVDLFLKKLKSQKTE